MRSRSSIAVLAVSTALLAPGCGEDDKRTDRGELIPRLTDTGLTVKYRSVKPPEELPVLETVAGQARDGDGPVVDFALVVWEPAYTARTWHPIAAGTHAAARVGNVEIYLPQSAPQSVANDIRAAVRQTAPEAK